MLGLHAQQTAPDSMPGCIYNLVAPTLTTGQTVPWQCDSSGKLITSGSGGGGSPGGANTNVQFNSSGSFGGDSGFTYLGSGIGRLSASLAVGGCAISTNAFCVTGASALGATTVTTSFTATGLVTVADLATQATNTVLGNATSGTASPTALAVGSCSTGNSALIWTTNTGYGCNTSMAALNVADQTVTGGANVTTLGLSTGNITVDCGSRPTQSITNGGAFTITAPAADGSCLLLVTNNGSAGAITFSGFSVGSNTGDSYATTNTNKYTLFVWRVATVSGYRWAAHQ
jgi:hypothetical protein